MASSDRIERQAIGRHGIIGSLYDIRTDQLEGGNLFKKELPASFTKITDSANTHVWLDSHNSQKKTFDDLNIEADLKVSLMVGLAQLEGAGKYLKQTKTNSNTVRVTYIYQVKTKQEHLQISADGLDEYFSLGAFDNPNATHVVIGILWGANVAATFERTVENQAVVEKIEGSLSAAMRKPMTEVSGQAKVKHDDQNQVDLESLKITFTGDVIIDNCPQTVDGVIDIYKTVPSLVKSLNDGKGQQLTFILYPLKQIAKMSKFELKIERFVENIEMCSRDKVFLLDWSKKCRMILLIILKTYLSRSMREKEN